MFSNRCSSLTVLGPLDETLVKGNGRNNMVKSPREPPHNGCLLDATYTAFQWCTSSDGTSTASTERRSFDSSSSGTSSSGRSSSDSISCHRWAGERKGDEHAPPAQSSSSLSSGVLDSAAACSAAVCAQFAAASLSQPLPGINHSLGAAECCADQCSLASVSAPLNMRDGGAEACRMCRRDGGHASSRSGCSSTGSHCYSTSTNSSVISQSSSASVAAYNDLRRAQSDLNGFLSGPSAWGGEVSDDGEDSDGDERAAREIKEAIGRSASMRYQRSWSATAQAGLGSDVFAGPRKLAGLSSGGASAMGQHHGSEGPTGLTRTRSNYHLTNRHAAVELFLRLNHTRQTLDYVKRQTTSYAALDKGELGVWDALSLLNEARDYEATLMHPGELSPDMPLMDHAFQTAELCRLRHPEVEWLPLVGLIHGLGKLLAHGRFGAQPQWAVSGESFPLGCRFSPLVEGAEFFMANPDRRRRQLNTPCGMYAQHCGLTNVYMSWSAAEYLYLVLALNDTSLPPEALFIIRHQKFWTLLSEGGGSSGYAQLLSADDERMLPLLAEFQKLAVYRDVGPLPAGALQGPELKTYYSGLIAKYLGTGKLSW